MTKFKIQNKSKCQIPNYKTKVLLFVIWALTLFCALCFGICHSHIYAQQDNTKLVDLTKQIMEAKTNEELFVSFEELRDLYLKENKYNEFVDFLNSLSKQKKTLEPVLNYYIALTRYHQLKHLEETQSWDEYFSQGNNYRDQLTQSAQKAIELLSPQDFFSVYTRLILWKFHQDQQDALSESALSDLLNSTLAYVKNAINLNPIKDVAGELLAYDKKAKAKELYRIYVTRLIASKIKDEALKATALGFYQEANLDLAESIYDAYIEKISATMSKEKLSILLIDIAKLFSYKDREPNDPLYAEKIFQKIEDTSGKDAFNEQLLYLRAFNLEKAKEYRSAKDAYLELLKHFPQSVHSDEADFKLGIIYTYILREIKTAKTYFEKLSQKEIATPQAISSLYQLGLLSQWEGDTLKAKEYYQKLLEKAGESFLETVGLAKERLKEIEAEKPIAYELKMFLDASFKEEYARLDMSKLDLKPHPYTPKKEESVNISSNPYVTESGCLEVQQQYLWSGHLGTAKPPPDESAFNTTYTQAGTKEINLVVISPTGIIDRNLDILDVY